MAISFEESKNQLSQSPTTVTSTVYSVRTMAAADNWTRDDNYAWFDSFTDDKISYVDQNKDISVDSSQVNISQEVKSQFIPFEMPRYYDGVDLSKMAISIHFTSSDKQHAASPAVNVQYSSDRVRFAWLVDANATHIDGNLQFEIHADGLIYDNKGNNYEYRWKSKPTNKFNITKSLCQDPNCEPVDINDTWVQDIVTNVAIKVAQEIKNVQIDLSNYYTKTETDNRIDEKLPTELSQLNDDTTHRLVTDAEKATWNAKSDFSGNYNDLTNKPTNVSTFTNDAGYLTQHQSLAEYATKKYVQDAVAAVDVSDQLKDYALKSEVPSIEGLATEDFVKDEIAKVDVSDQLKDYAISADVYTKTEIDAKEQALNTSIEANTTNITSLSGVVTGLQTAVGEIDKSPRKTYDVAYNDTEDPDVGENVFVFYEIENEGLESERKEPKKKFTIVGGGGGGTSSSIKIEYVTKTPIVATLSDEVVIKYNFSGTDSSGDPVLEGVATWKVAGKIVATNTAVAGENSFDVTQYLTVGTQKVNLTIVDEAGSLVTKTWTVQKIDVRIESTFSDRYTTPIGRSVLFTYTPYGAASKTVHFKLDGVESTFETSASGILQSYSINPQSHGAHLLEVWITAVVNSVEIETEHIYKDIIWYDEESTDVVIGCIYRNDYYGEVTARQYDTTKIIYNVFDPTTNYPVINRYVDDELVGTDTATESQNIWNFQTDKVGVHTLKIVVRDKEVVIVINVVELGIDVSPITSGLEIDFNPVGITNNSANKIWSNDKYSMSVSDNFDWSNGGYHIDENGDAYFLVKSGTRASFDYLMFAGGIDSNPSILGSEMKIIFKTEKVQRTDAVWFSNVESITTEVDGMSQTTNVGIQLGVHEGWLKTNNASGSDVKADDGSDLAATNTYLYMPYSEEDIIEMDINIDAINRESDTSKSFVMAYEDGVPSKAFVYDKSDRFYQYTPQPIVIGSDYCDVRIYRMKIYSTSLTTENIMKNFIADARNSTTILQRYDRNSIYYNRETNTYSPYSGEGVLDPEKLAPIIPNVKVLMLETDHFTTSKKTFVKSTLRCIHAPGGDMFNGDAIYDNWLFENGWHSGRIACPLHIEIYVYELRKKSGRLKC